MIAGADENADTLLEKRGSRGSQIGHGIRRGIPQSEKGFRGDRLAEAHHGFAVRKGEDFDRTIENRGRERCEARQRIAVPNFQRGSIDRNNLLDRGTDPNGCAIEGKIGAGCARYGNLCDAGLASGGEDFHAIHGAIGDEHVLVGGIVGDVAMMRFTERIV